ncbi:MAG: rhomboid family intramembrane serine protease [Caldilineaceae bacterium]|nr:rhomboid family intramembrane serine protease [Caldilineaceae bacterium]
MTQSRISTAGRAIRQHAFILIGVVGLLWFLESADYLIWRGNLDWYGIFPRTRLGLRNIVIAPFLHVGFSHLLANTLPFLILGWFVLLRSTRDFLSVFFTAAVVSGLGIWIFGTTNSVHIGMSGVIFGFLGFLMMRGALERSLASIALAAAALFLYGGMLWGILPGQPGISWLGHLFGFIGGGLAAYLLIDRSEQPAAN